MILEKKVMINVAKFFSFSKNCILRTSKKHWYFGSPENRSLRGRKKLFLLTGTLINFCVLVLQDWTDGDLKIKVILEVGYRRGKYLRFSEYFQEKKTTLKAWNKKRICFSFVGEQIHFLEWHQIRYFHKWRIHECNCKHLMLRRGNKFDLPQTKNIYPLWILSKNKFSTPFVLDTDACLEVFKYSVSFFCTIS